MIFFSYADPGSGVLLWQFLIAVGAGFLFYLKHIISFIKSKILKKKKPDEEP